MKIQLDTIAKIIKLEESVNVGELMDILERMLPNGGWREFELQIVEFVDYQQPIIIRDYIPYDNPNPTPYVPIYPITPSPINPVFPGTNPSPWWQMPWVICGDQCSGNYSLKSGVYNLEF